MRKSWTEYFLGLAEETATRSTCLKRQVGCIITDRENNILSTGYNGSPRGSKHCSEEGCLINSFGNCIRTIHAEQNAIARLDKYSSAFGLYCTDEPCLGCLKLIIATGIRRIYFLRNYTNPDRDIFFKWYTSQQNPFDSLSERFMYQKYEQQDRI